MTKFDTIVFGATFAGVGYAFAGAVRGEKIAVVEPTINIGTDFCGCFKYAPILKNADISATGRRFYELAERHKLVCEIGENHLPSLASVLALMLKEAGTEVFFLSAPVHIERRADGFTSELFSVDGIQRLESRRVIDTTANGILSGTQHMSKETFELGARKRLAASLVSNKPDTIELVGKEYRIAHGLYPDEYYFSVDVPPDCDYMHARALLHTSWELSVGEGKIRGLLMGAAASYFAFDFDNPCMYTDGNFGRCISASHLSPLEALERGAEFSWN